MHKRQHHPGLAIIFLCCVFVAVLFSQAEFVGKLADVQRAFGTAFFCTVAVLALVEMADYFMFGED